MGERGEEERERGREGGEGRGRGERKMERGIREREREREGEPMASQIFSEASKSWLRMFCNEVADSLCVSIAQ